MALATISNRVFSTVIATSFLSWAGAWGYAGYFFFFAGLACVVWLVLYFAHGVFGNLFKGLSRIAFVTFAALGSSHSQRREVGASRRWRATSSRSRASRCSSRTAPAQIETIEARSTARQRRRRVHISRLCDAFRSSRPLRPIRHPTVAPLDLNCNFLMCTTIAAPRANSDQYH
jgi:hypothetical protein